MKQIPEKIMALLRDRGYLRENESSWEDLSRRVAKALASAEKECDKEKYEEEFYRLLSNQKFVNSTPTLMNAEAGNMGGLSSCFVIDVRDDLAGIHEAMGKCAKIYQYNGGVGFDISPLRPARAPLGTARGFAGGPVAFMSEFNEGARVATLYNERKSATKIDMQVWHPDVHKFIHCKDDGQSLTLMNISVSITDKFMEAVKNDEDWQLIFPDYEKCKDIYNAEWDGDIDKWISKGYPVKVYETLKARELFRELCESAWLRGDPGISFIDKLNVNNPNKHISRVTATNPCAEFNSIPYTSCCLGSFNLMAYTNEHGQIDMDALQHDIPIAVRMLDNVITLNKYPLPEIEKMTKENRSIGIGLMGLADVMYLKGIRYGSPESVEFVNDLFKFLTTTAEEASHYLSFERGSYVNWVGSSHDKKNIHMRNSDVTSIAPTGSISTICGVSSSIEPNFGLVYERHTADDRVFFIVNPIFERALKDAGLYHESLMKKISDNHGSCVGIPEIPEWMQKVFVTTHDVTPKEHIEVCAAVQANISLSVSKTVNLPNSATVEDVAEIYMYAYDKGMLGITVYRDGCRDSQVLTTGASYKKDKQEDEEKSELVSAEDAYQWGELLKPSKSIIGLKRKLRTGCGSVHFKVYFDLENGGHITDVYADRGGGGGCVSLLSTTSRLISRSLRLGDTPEKVAEDLQDTLPCTSYSHRRGSGKETSPGFNCASSMGKALVEMNHEFHTKFYPLLRGGAPVVIDDDEDDEPETIESPVVEKVTSRKTCPECKSELASDGGCTYCPSCGYSKCG